MVKFLLPFSNRRYGIRPIVAVGRFFTSSAANDKPKKQKVPLGPVIINNVQYNPDSWTNLTPRIQSHIGRNIYLQPHHPLSIIRQHIVDYFYKTFPTNRGNPVFTVCDGLSPVVTIEQNFDSLLVPKEHVSRSKSDSFYLNRDHMLRAHCTAHQAELLISGLDNFLIIGDVYRRDTINATHHPAFHQVDAVRTLHRDKLFVDHPDLEIFEPNYVPGQRTHGSEADKQACHTLEAVKLTEHEMKKTLIGLVQHLFGEKIQYRWVDAYFPFTHPSWELEIYFNGTWLEVLGAGVMRNNILESSNVLNTIGWAFGLGLERLAMVLYNIPDIRIFWSTDSGFLHQFHETKTTAQMQFIPVSTFAQLYMDMSFWLPEQYDLETFPYNSYYALIRETGGDIVEQVGWNWIIAGHIH